MATVSTGSKKPTGERCGTFIHPKKKVLTPPAPEPVTCSDVTHPFQHSHPSTEVQGCSSPAQLRSRIFSCISPVGTFSWFHKHLMKIFYNSTTSEWHKPLLQSHTCFSFALGLCALSVPAPHIPHKVFSLYIGPCLV